MKKLTVMQKLLLSYSLLVLGITILMGIYILPVQLRGMESNLKNEISETAHLLSVDSDIINGVERKQFSDSLINKLNGVREKYKERIDYIVIADKKGIRKYHPDVTCIGKRFSGGDEEKVLKDGNSYITTRQGEHDVQKRAFAPVKNEAKEIVGFVMVSASLTTIQKQQRHIIMQFISIFLLVLFVGICVAYIISKNIREMLLGFEPGTFTKMYLQREEILDNLDEGILAVNKKEEMLYSNPAAEEIFHSVEKIKSSTIYEQMKQCLTGKKSILNQLVEVGENTLIASLIPLIREGEAEAVLVIFRNKTELTKMAEQLTGTNHVIDALRANTHEYMNKLHVISGLLQIGEISDAMNYISEVSSDIANGYQTVVRQIQNKTIAALILGKQNRSKELNIDFTLRKDSFLEAHNAYISTKELVTIVGNLIENAFEAVKNADKLKQVELFIGSTENGLTLTIDDTGHGMGKEQINKIYNGQYTTKGEGHGYGLRLIREIVQRHNGYLEIESEPLVGTSFAINFSEKRDGYNIIRRKL